MRFWGRASTDFFFSSSTVDLKSLSVLSDLEKKFIWHPGYLHCGNAMIFGTMLAKLSTFYVPKAGRRATFGSGRNSAKFWRHSAVSGLGSCIPCLFILYMATPGI